MNKASFALIALSMTFLTTACNMGASNSDGSQFGGNPFTGGTGGSDPNLNFDPTTFTGGTGGTGGSGGSDFGSGTLDFGGTGTGIPDSAEEAEDLGVGASEVPTNSSGGIDISALLAQWEASVGSNAPSSLNPQNLPPEFSSALQYLYCDSRSDFQIFQDNAYVFLTATYLDILGAMPDAASANPRMAYLVNNFFWQTGSSAKHYIRSNVAYDILLSARANRRYVTGAWYAFYNEEPTENDITTWVNRMSTSFETPSQTTQKVETLDELYYRFTSNTKYWQKAGQNIRTFVRNLYRDLLYRFPQEWEITYWVNWKNDNSKSLTDLSKAIGETDERYLKLIWSSYAYYLGRYPTQAEVQQKYYRMRYQGWEIRAIIADIMGMDDYLVYAQQRFGGGFFNANQCQ